MRRNHRSRATSRAPVGQLGLPTRSTLTASGPLRTPLPRKPIRSGQCQLRCHDKLRSSHCQSSALTLKPPAAGGPMDWALVSMGEEDAAQPPEPSYFTRSCGPLGLPTRPTLTASGPLRTPLPRLGHRLRRSSRLGPWSLREWKVRRNHRSCATPRTPIGPLGQALLSPKQCKRPSTAL